MTDFFMIFIYFGGCSYMHQCGRNWLDIMIWPFYLGRWIVANYVKDVR